MKDAEYIKCKFIKWLLDGNLSFNITKGAIGVEVLFSTKRRKADILILSQDSHAIEIKGDFDDLRKLKQQLNDYHKTFDKVSIATTPKHLPKIRAAIKANTGLILFENDMLKIIRSAGKQKKLDKRSLLMFLPKPDLANLLNLKNRNDFYTNQIRKIAAKKLTIKKIQKATHSFLLNRHKTLFNLFLKDIGNNIHTDDLRALSGKIEKLSI